MELGLIKTWMKEYAEFSMKSLQEYLADKKTENQVSGIGMVYKETSSSWSERKTPLERVSITTIH